MHWKYCEYGYLSVLSGCVVLAQDLSVLSGCGVLAQDLSVLSGCGVLAQGLSVLSGCGVLAQDPLPCMGGIFILLIELDGICGQKN
jgi:hypothetical protein